MLYYSSYIPLLSVKSEQLQYMTDLFVSIQKDTILVWILGSTIPSAKPTANQITVLFIHMGIDAVEDILVLIV